MSSPPKPDPQTPNSTTAASSTAPTPAADGAILPSQVAPAFSSPDAQPVAEAGEGAPDKKPEPEIIPLDFPDGPTDEEIFIEQKAVLGALDPQPGSHDGKETDLLQRIWRAGKDMGHPYAEILRAKNPSDVKIRIKELVAILENIAFFMEELDRYRQGVVGELIHQYGLSDCPILRNGEGVSLADSDQLLESLFLNQVCALDRIIFECRFNAGVLRYTDERLLRGTDGYGRFGLDRRGWEAEFRSFVILAERHGSRLRQKMVERRLGIERAAKWRKKELEKAPSAFAVAKGVARANKATLQ